MVWLHRFGESSQGLWFHMLFLNTKGTKKQTCCTKSEMYFLGVSNTTEAYHIYDEVNKEFILSIDFILLEMNKNDKYIKRHLDRLEKNFPCKYIL